MAFTRFFIQTQNNQTHIACIKEHTLKRDLPSAWIGSYNAFHKMQELRKSPKTSLELFKRSVNECGDDSVGGFIICNAYYENEQQFLFSTRLESYVERVQLVKPNEKLILSDTAEWGGCTLMFHESPNDVIIDICQINRSIVYTNRYRYDQSDVDNEKTNRFLLPIVVETSTKKIL